MNDVLFVIIALSATFAFLVGVVAVGARAARRDTP